MPIATGLPSSRTSIQAGRSQLSTLPSAVSSSATGTSTIEPPYSATGRPSRPMPGLCVGPGSSTIAWKSTLLVVPASACGSAVSASSPNTPSVIATTIVATREPSAIAVCASSNAPTMSVPLTETCEASAASILPSASTPTGRHASSTRVAVRSKRIASTSLPSGSVAPTAAITLATLARPTSSMLREVSITNSTRCAPVPVAWCGGARTVAIVDVQPSPSASLCVHTSGCSRAPKPSRATSFAPSSPSVNRAAGSSFAIVTPGPAVAANRTLQAWPGSASRSAPSRISASADHVTTSVASRPAAIGWSVAR